MFATTACELWPARRSAARTIYQQLPEHLSRKLPTRASEFVISEPNRGWKIYSIFLPTTPWCCWARNQRGNYNTGSRYSITTHRCGHNYTAHGIKEFGLASGIFIAHIATRCWRNVYRSGLPHAAFRRSILWWNQKRWGDYLTAVFLLPSAKKKLWDLPLPPRCRSGTGG